MFGKRSLPENVLKKKRERSVRSENSLFPSSLENSNKTNSCVEQDENSTAVKISLNDSSCVGSFSSSSSICSVLPQTGSNNDNKQVAKAPEKEKQIVDGKVSSLTDSLFENEIDENLEEDTTISRVRDYKLIQKARRRNKGLNSQISFIIEEKIEEEVVGYGLLDKQFTSRDDRNNTEVDAHLEEYLKNHLEKKDEKKEEKTRKYDDKAAELYKIPKHLQVKDTISEHAERMNWVTGLVEVPLPLEVKLKNIEATEKAKRALLKLGKAEQNIDSDPDFIVNKAFGSRFQNYERFSKSKLATDRLTLERFKKRFRNK